MKQFSKDLGNVSLAPKGKWSREQEYERLALVYNACDNLSYVAKIDVPIGVEIDNREYWQPMNATGYADNNFINLTTENENGTITAYESIEEAIATIVPINRRAGATLSFYNLNADRLDRQAEFELWQFNSTDLANWENKDYWNNIYYNWNVFVGWYIGADALKNHVEIPNVGQYAYVGSNLNDAILYQCRTNGTWTNTGIKVRNYISVVVSGNITIGENGNWFSDGEDTGIPATPAIDEQIDNIITKHESLSKTVQSIAATGGASTATNVTYNNDASGLNAENAQDAIDELQSSKIDKTSILQELGEAENKIMSQKAIKTELDKKANKADMVVELAKKANTEDVDVKLDKKFDKESVTQKSGNSEELVMSQKAVSDKLRYLDNKVSTQLPEIEGAKNEALNNIKENEQSAIFNFNAQRVTPEMLSESTKQLIETSGGGTITNLADDEDLTSVDDGTGSNVLKFADKEYRPEKFSGKGYKRLRKNIQKIDLAVTKITVNSAPTKDGEISITINNIDTNISLVNDTHNTTAIVAQTISDALVSAHTDYNIEVTENIITLTRKHSGEVASSAFDVADTGVTLVIEDSTKSAKRNILTPAMINQPNTIYEIRYDFDLNGETLEVPKNSTLKFKGGSLNNGVISNVKNINSDNYHIFKDIIIKNSETLRKLNVTWFGAKGDYIYGDNDFTDNSTIINTLISDYPKCSLYFPEGYYACNNSINFDYPDDLHDNAIEITGDGEISTALVYTGNNENTNFIIFTRIYLYWKGLSIVLPRGYKGNSGVYMNPDKNIINFCYSKLYICGGWNYRFYGKHVNIQFSELYLMTINMPMKYNIQLDNAKECISLGVEYNFGGKLYCCCENFNNNGIHLYSEDEEKSTIFYNLTILSEGDGDCGAIEGIRYAYIDYLYTEFKSNKKDMIFRSCKNIVIRNCTSRIELYSCNNVRLLHGIIGYVSPDSKYIYTNGSTLWNNKQDSKCFQKNVITYKNGNAIKLDNRVCGYSEYITENFISNIYNKNKLITKIEESSLANYVFPFACKGSSTSNLYINTYLKYIDLFDTDFTDWCLSFKIKIPSFTSITIDVKHSKGVSSINLLDFNCALTDDNGWYYAKLFMDLNKNRFPDYETFKNENVELFIKVNSENTAYMITQLSLTKNNGVNQVFILNSNEHILDNIISGTTEKRPNKSLIYEGFEYYDTTLKKKILWNGTAWANLDGTELAQ